LFGVDRIKKSFGDVIKEHPYSIVVFFIGTLLWAISIGDGPSGSEGDVFKLATECGRILCMGVSLGVLLCETISVYRAERNNEGNHFGLSGRIITNIAIILASLCATLQYWLLNEYSGLKSFFGSDYKLYQELSLNIFICVMTAIVGTTVFFFYKRREDSFEEYAARAFCGLMKAELVYGIIAVGFLLVLWAFNVLIYDTEKFDLIERSEILILGLVEFPCVIAGLSRTKEKTGKFGKAVLSYVLPALLSLGFVIIYIYIIKILVTWKFPSNEVFSILTALFACGAVIWTMASGCCDDNLRKIIKILPILFIPFIVLQVMCLFMRVSDYGFTMNRYFGAALIVFEIAYFLLYICRLVSGKDIMAGAIFMVIAASILILLFPGTNMYSVITNSQKKKIEKYIELGDAASYKDKTAAGEAYNEIKDSGGFSGKRFLSDELSEEQLKYVKEIDPSNVEDSDFYISVTQNIDLIDTSDYSKVYVIQNDFSDDYDDGYAEINLKELLLTIGDENEVIGTVDLSGIMDELIKNDQNDSSTSDDSKVLEQEIVLTNGGKLIITYLCSWGTTGENNHIEYLNFEGYLLK
jgi:hypothetical protein